MPMSTACCRPTAERAVEAWLASHPEDAARVAEWRAQAEAVRDRYGSVAEEPVPARFDLAKLARPRTPWRTIAAAAVLAAMHRRRCRLDRARRLDAGADRRSRS